MPILPVHGSADAMRRLDLEIEGLPEERKYIAQTLTAIRQWIAANATAPPPTLTGSNAALDTTTAITVVEKPAQATPDSCNPPLNSRHARPRRLPMIPEITLQNLHQRLAYHQERTELSVETTHGEKRTIVSIDHGERCFLPDSVRHVDFDQMLAHYPVPVPVNGNPLPRRPYHDEAGISRSSYDGDIADTRLNSRQPIAGPYQGLFCWTEYSTPPALAPT